MKRLLIVLLTIVIAVPLVFGGMLGYSYYSTGEDAVPQPVVGFLGKELHPVSYEWHEPVFTGVMFKEFNAVAGLATENLGVLSGQQQLGLAAPEGYTTTASIKKGDTVVWNGAAEDIGGYVFRENGEYVLEVRCDKPQEKKNGYGVFYYSALFTVSIAPTLEVSGESVKQGDVLAVRLSNLFGAVAPTIEVDFEMMGEILFMPNGEGSMIAFVPVTHNRESGKYTVKVTAGEYSWELPLNVVAVDFGKQYMTIDVTDPEVSEASSPAAYQQYRDKIYPMFEATDPARYWQGKFVTPAPGSLSTTYALTRYTNGVPGNPHPAIDIKADEGTPVVAPNAGKVLLAENLLNTGGTIVIEHGGGLKSYYFHLSRLDVEAGQTVETGQLIGAVGTTGYSTGPHLHFEVRIGNQSLNPSALLDGESGLYYFETGV